MGKQKSIYNVALNVAVAFDMAGLSKSQASRHLENYMREWRHRDQTRTDTTGYMAGEAHREGRRDGMER
jgi:hypothetical protein